MVIDPSGKIVAERTEPGPGILYAQIHHQKPELVIKDESDVTYTERMRSMLPVEVSRRHDLFPLPDAGTPIREV